MDPSLCFSFGLHLASWRSFTAYFQKLEHGHGIDIFFPLFRVLWGSADGRVPNLWLLRQLDSIVVHKLGNGPVLLFPVPGPIGDKWSIWPTASFC